ncbi:Methionyl-tRNA formyltransferase [Nymphon striatum]|nr:Methionyl-tRNA formyltransferase [Nymphon striatum]
MTARICIPWPDKRLRTAAAPVDQITDEVRGIWDDMIDTMEAMPGVGLGANQIGVMLRLAVVDASEERGKAVRMANPEILHASTQPRDHEEASPNLPGVSAKITRPRAVTVRFLNENGEMEERDFVGLWATSVQHQIDHLNGKMYFDNLSGHDVVCAYSQPPRPAGRGKKDRPSPVQAKAEALGIPIRHPASLRTPEAQADFAALEADIAVVVAYGLILPQAILDAPALGCLNIHASLLPRWRGAAPIHRAIMAGDTETGQLHDRLSALGAEAIVDALSSLPTLTPETQPDVGVTYAEKIDKAEAAIDWSQPAQVIDRQIRGLSPFPGAWTMIAGQRVKCLGSEMVDGSGAAGTVLDDKLTVGCGAGAIRLTRLQRAGKGAQDVDVFLRGWPVTVGQVLGE